MGEHSINPNTEKTKDKMGALEYSLKHLTDQMMYITRLQAYQRVNKYVTVLPANITIPQYDSTCEYIPQQGAQRKRQEQSGTF